MAAQDPVVQFLRRELVRVDRPDVTVDSGPNGTVTLKGKDGQWTGPAPAARIALDKTPDGRGKDPDFWKRFPS